MMAVTYMCSNHSLPNTQSQNDSDSPDFSPVPNLCMGAEFSPAPAGNVHGQEDSRVGESRKEMRNRGPAPSPKLHSKGRMSLLEMRKGGESGKVNSCPCF